jgi:hypothetical protein
VSPGRAFAVLGLLLLLLGLGVWHPQPAGVWHDDGVYLLLGKTLAEDHALAYGGVVGTPPAAKFPPLYPALVGAVWTVAPSFPANVRVIAAVNVGLMALAGVAFAILCFRVFGLGLAWSVGATAITWLSVDLWRVAVIPLSEALFVLSLVLALLGAARALGDATDEQGGGVDREARGAGDARSLIFLFIGFAVVTHVRSVGVALGAAAVVVAVSYRRWRQAAGLVVAFGAILLPWSWWSARATARIPDSLRDVLGSYGGFIRDRVDAGGIDVLWTLPARALGLVDWCLAVLLPGVPSMPRWILGVVMVPVLVLGLVEMLRRSRLVGLTVLFLLAALWLWPFVDRRLMAPLVPWLALAMVLGGSRASGIAVSTSPLAVARDWRNSRSWTLLGVMAWGLFFGISSTVGLGRGWHDAGYRVRAPAVLEAAETVARSTAVGDVVGAPELWAALHLYTGRTVAPSAPFEPGALETPVWGTPERQVRLWVDAGLDLVLAEHGGRVHQSTLDRIGAECGDDALEVAGRYEGAVLVRLAWDESCRARLLPEG